MPCGLFFAVNYFFKNVLTKNYVFFLYQEFFSGDFRTKNRHFFSFFASYFALKNGIFSMIALEHGAAPSEKPFAAAFWRAAFFMKMSKTIVLQKLSFSQIFSVFFYVSGFNRLNRACARTWLFFDHVGCEKSLFWGFSSDYGTIFRSFCQNSSFKEQF